MIIYLQSPGCIDVIRQILTEFGEHTLDEIVGYFPNNTYDYIVKAIEILEHKKEIEFIEQENIKYYRRISVKNRFLNSNIPKRNEYEKALEFLRIMINDTDKGGKLKNNIPYLCKGYYPCALYFECNGKIYDVYYIPYNRIEPTTALINRMDNSNKYIEDTPNCRIIITDSPENFPLIKIKNIKYKVTIENDGSLTFR